MRLDLSTLTPYLVPGTTLVLKKNLGGSVRDQKAAKIFLKNFLGPK
jgi:hypothetical protein